MFCGFARLVIPNRGGKNIKTKPDKIKTKQDYVFYLSLVLHHELTTF